KFFRAGKPAFRCHPQIGVESVPADMMLQPALEAVGHRRAGFLVLESGTVVEGKLFKRFGIEHVRAQLHNQGMIRTRGPEDDREILSRLGAWVPAVDIHSHDIPPQSRRSNRNLADIVCRSRLADLRAAAFLWHAPFESEQ